MKNENDVKAAGNAEFARLVSEEKNVRERMKNLIVATLKENNGKLSFVPEDEDGEYPVCATLWGKHDSPNIEISDVYLGKSDGIFADGYDQSTGILEKAFEIYPEQYWEILHFIAAVLGWKDTVEEEREEQKDKPFEVTVLFGSDLILEYETTGELPSEEWLMDNGGVVETKSFATKEEMNAYLEGLNDCDGWGETLVLDEFTENLLKENREKEY